MAYFVDQLLVRRYRIGNSFFIAKPLKRTLRERLRDAVGVITGRYMAVAFVETEQVKDRHWMDKVSLLPDETVRRTFDLTDEAIKRKIFAKADRNGKCPCGSGKKYKKCCLRHPAGSI